MSGIYAMVIHAEGHPEALDIDPGQLLLPQINEWFGCSIDMCTTHPMGPLGVFGRFPMAVDERGYYKPDRPMNRKATWLYGGSPLVGPALVMADSDEPGCPQEIPAGAVEVINGPIVAADDERLDRWLEANPRWRG